MPDIQYLTILTLGTDQVYRCVGYCKCSIFITFTIDRAYPKLRYGPSICQDATKSIGFDSYTEYWHYCERPETFVR